MFGIAARNGILLVNHAQHLEREEGQEWGPALVLRAAKERLAPILMTSLATGLALVPLVVLGERPGHEIEHRSPPSSSAASRPRRSLSLFVLPSLLLRFGRGAAPNPPAPHEQAAAAIPLQRITGGA